MFGHRERLWRLSCRKLMFAHKSIYLFNYEAKKFCRNKNYCTFIELGKIDSRVRIKLTLVENFISFTGFVIPVYLGNAQIEMGCYQAGIFALYRRDLLYWSIWLPDP